MKKMNTDEYYEYVYEYFLEYFALFAVFRGADCKAQMHKNTPLEHGAEQNITLYII